MHYGFRKFNIGELGEGYTGTFYDLKKIIKFSQADEMCIGEAQQREG